MAESSQCQFARSLHACDLKTYPQGITAVIVTVQMCKLPVKSQDQIKQGIQKRGTSEIGQVGACVFLKLQGRYIELSINCFNGQKYKSHSCRKSNLFNLGLAHGNPLGILKVKIF